MDRRRLVTAFALAVGLALTAVAGWTSHRLQERVATQREELRQDSVVSAVQLALDRIALAVRAVRAMYAADWVSADQFERFARTLTANEGIRSLGFYRRIEDRQRKNYEAAITTDPGRTLGIWEYDNSRTPVRAPERPFYYVVESGYSRIGGPTSYALNVASLPGRGDSLLRASSAFDIIVSERIAFANDDAAGVAFYANTLDRNGAVAGVAAGTATFEDVADVARRTSGVSGIRVDLAAGGGTKPVAAGPMSRQFQFGGQTWIVSIPEATPSLTDRWLPLLVVGVGLAATATVLAYLFALDKTRALGEAEARLSNMLDGLGPLVWLLERDGTVVHANQAARTALAMESGEIAGKAFADLPLRMANAGSVDVVRQALATVATGKEARFDLAVRGDGDGGDEMLDFWIRPLAGDDGQPLGIVVSAVDVTDRFEGEQTQRLLMRELDHRMKNTLQVVQAVIRRTARSQATIPQFERSLLGRVGAMSRAHELLAQERWIGADLATLLRQETAVFDAGGAIRLSGPAMRLNPRAALSLALAVHELATNASKYGALSVAAGTATAGWSVDRKPGEPLLVFRWEEAGGPRVAEPESRGFGSMLIERSIAYELDGRATMDYRETGLMCTIAIPLRTIRPFVAERPAEAAQ